MIGSPHHSRFLKGQGHLEPVYMKSGLQALRSRNYMDVSGHFENPNGKQNCFADTTGCKKVIVNS